MRLVLRTYRAPLRMTTLAIALVALTLFVHHRANDPAQVAASLDRAQNGLAVVSAISAALVAVLSAVQWIDVLRPPAPLISGERVVLRPLGRRDGPALARTIDQAVLDENRLPPDTAEQAKRLVRRTAVANWAAICDASSRDVVGVVTMEFDEPRRNATLGIWIGPDHRGKGYASDATAAAARLALGMGYDTTALTSQANTAMQRALERGGFVRTGTVEHVFDTGEVIEAIRFEHRDVADAAG
jgi:RimJ/RimL family protein N-acetyltransferase